MLKKALEDQYEEEGVLHLHATQPETEPPMYEDVKEVTLFTQKHSGSKGVNFEKRSPILRCEHRA
jgi:hypothetical protein